MGQSSENRPESVWIWIVFCRKREIRFYSLGDQLGYLGLDMQLKQMDLMEKETEYAIRELRKDFCEKRNYTAVWEYLGGIICGCVFLVSMYL